MQFTRQSRPVPPVGGILIPKLLITNDLVAAWYTLKQLCLLSLQCQTTWTLTRLVVFLGRL